jgi:hypothetical protein
VSAVFTKAVGIVGVSVLLTSGKEPGITNLWTICEVKTVIAE